MTLVRTVMFEYNSWQISYLQVCMYVSLSRVEVSLNVRFCIGCCKIRTFAIIFLSFSCDRMTWLHQSTQIFHLSLWFGQMLPILHCCAAEQTTWTTVLCCQLSWSTVQTSETWGVCRKSCSVPTSEKKKNEQPPGFTLVIKWERGLWCHFQIWIYWSDSFTTNKNFA